ncbi:hypothetical protein PYCC9005_003954 [Savitreella phatthalungensis]
MTTDEAEDELNFEPDLFKLEKGSGFTSDSEDGDQDEQVLPSIDGITIKILPKEGKALTLIADAIFSPALVLAECIFTGLLNVRGRSLIELGCGTGLVGLAAARHGATTAFLTDFDADEILDNPRENLRDNLELLSGACVVVAGHTWGTSADRVIEQHRQIGQSRDGRFDIVVLSDILWYDSSHRDILSSTEALLRTGGEVWISSGRYTKNAEGFLALAQTIGFMHNEITLESDWHGPPTTGMGKMSRHKDNSRLWKMWRE